MSDQANVPQTPVFAALAVVARWSLLVYLAKHRPTAAARRVHEYSNAGQEVASITPS